MLQLALHYSARDLDVWDQLARTYRVDRVFAVGLPADNATGKWGAVLHPDHIESDLPRVWVSSSSAKYAPGETSLGDFGHPADALYIFGSDEMHNSAVRCDHSVFIPTPSEPSALWSHQAALLVLHDRWLRG